jgi:predicted ATPase
LLQALAERGYNVVTEAALALVQEQERTGGDLLPWTRRDEFMREVLARNIRAYEAALSLEGPVFFDRAVPECLAHMKLQGMEVREEEARTCQRLRYAKTVFVAEPWPEIYVCDQWRRASFERAQRSYEATVAAYVDDGYEACILPKLSIEERVEFVVRCIKA